MINIKIIKTPPYRVGIESRIKIGTIRTVLYKSPPDERGIIEYKIDYKGKFRFVTNEYCIEI